MRDATLFVVDTELSQHELRAKLEAWAPWRHEIQFSNGVSTTDFEMIQPFAPRVLRKLRRMQEHVQIPDGARVLDIGCNAGYNLIQLARESGCTGVGLDFSRRHIDVSRFLAELSGAQGLDFVHGDANHFRPDGSFDVILHFGTLYHLRHPVLSLENAIASLTPGGLLALETQCYRDENDCRYFRRDTADHTNWFALGPLALVDIMETVGFVDIPEILSVQHYKFEHMSRRMFIGRAP